MLFCDEMCFRRTRTNMVDFSTFSVFDQNHLRLRMGKEGEEKQGSGSSSSNIASAQNGTLAQSALRAATYYVLLSYYILCIIMILYIMYYYIMLCQDLCSMDLNWVHPRRSQWVQQV